MAASRPRYTEVVRRQLSGPSPFMAAAVDGGLKLENLSYGQLQVLSAVPAQNVASAMADDQQTSPEFYVGVPPPIMEGRGVVKKLWNGNVHIIPMHADWFCPNKVHNLEKQLSANLFSEQMTENYMNFRNSIVAKYSENPVKRLTIKDCLEMKGEINCKDANRIFQFLESWGIINYCANSPAPDHEPLNDSSYLMEESVQLPSPALNSIDCLIKFDNPKCSLKTPNGDDVSELENTIKEKLAENRCKYCSKPLFVDYYQSVKQDNVMLCLDCYIEGRFVIGHSSIDFSRLDCMKDDRDHADVDIWTDQETILLLEAMEMYGDNWHEIADHVGSKSKAECILHFLRLPVENGLLSNSDVPNSNGKSEGSCTQDSDSYNRLPFKNFGNPVMALVAFLASSLGPKVAAACAHAALGVLSECEGLSLNPSEEKILEETRNPEQQGDVSPRYGKRVKCAVEAGLIAAAIKAKLEADQEEREIQWHAAIIASAQIRRLDLKLTQLTEIDTLLLKQCEQFEKTRQKFVAERVIYMTTSPSLSPTLANANALVSNRLMSASSSFTSMVSGFGNQMNRSNNMQQPVFSFGPRLPFSIIQPSSSLHPQNDAYNAQGTGQSLFGHSVSRLVPGTSSEFS